MKKDKHHRPKMDAAQTAKLVISLDFELAWGIEHRRVKSGARKHIEGTRRAIPQILDLFDRFEVRATWATVGLLFFSNKDEMIAHLPPLKPRYARQELSAYNRLDEVGEDEDRDPVHFGLSLIRQIQGCPGQEIACHTFSHYYCMENGQDVDTFRADLDAAQNAARLRGLSLASLVFPRNQIRMNYMPACRDAGFKAVRGNPPIWLYRSRTRSQESLWLRGARLVDSMLPMSGSLTFAKPTIVDGVVDVRASMFLRPVERSRTHMDDLHLNRIKRSMRHAARTGECFHLWWHPENFGGNVEANIENLRKVLEAYRSMQQQYGMTSATMSDFLPDFH